MRTYSFKYPEITNCFDCPMFYDYLYCEADVDEDLGLVRSVKKRGTTISRIPMMGNGLIGAR